MIREPLPVQEREADWLRLMEGLLSLDFAHPGIENILRFVAPLLDTNDHSRFAEASKHRPLAWKIIQAAVAHLRARAATLSATLSEARWQSGHLMSPRAS